MKQSLKCLQGFSNRNMFRQLKTTRIEQPARDRHLRRADLIGRLFGPRLHEGIEHQMLPGILKSLLPILRATDFGTPFFSLPPEGQARRYSLFQFRESWLTALKSVAGNLDYAVPRCFEFPSTGHWNLLGTRVYPWMF